MTLLLGPSLVPVGGSTVSALVALLLVGVPAAPNLRRRFGPASPPAPAARLTAVVASPVLGTPELCLAWRRSYLTLVEPPAGAARAHIVAAPQSMPDKLRRRDGHGFRRRLAAGARPGSDPARYPAAGPGG